jgi:hypothetical protein
MSKRDIRNAFNKKVYQFAESLGYYVEDLNDGSFVTFTHPDEMSGVNTIDYHRSQQDICVLNWASDEVKADAVKIENYINYLKSNENV